MKTMFLTNIKNITKLRPICISIRISLTKICKHKFLHTTQRYEKKVGKSKKG